jgi:hypothetical protein
MVATLVAAVSVAVGLLALWQAYLRRRAHETGKVRELVADMRKTFQDIIAKGELDTSMFLTGPRHGLESRLTDLRNQLHDETLQARVDHLVARWRGVFASAPAPWIGMAQGSTVVTTSTPERRAQVERQVAAARDGLIEVDSVLDRCNQVDRLIVRP